MSDSTTKQPRRTPGQPMSRRPNAFQSPSRSSSPSPARPAAPRRPVLPPQHQASLPPQTPPLTAEELHAVQFADTHPPQFITGYDPGAQRIEPPFVPADMEDERQGEPEDFGEYDGEYEYDDADPADENSHLTIEEEGDDGEIAFGEQGLAANPWDDGEAPPPLPPTTMPVRYSRWLDLGELDDRDLARTYRGWKIKVRTDLSLDFLTAAEALQDAARAAKEMEQRSRGRVRAEVRIGHIRAVLADVLVAWNYVDERGLPLPQPQEGGLGRVRGDLMAATLNRAIMAVVPGKQRLRSSTPR